MAINIYKPWWIQTANPFEIEEEESIYPDGLLVRKCNNDCKIPLKEQGIY